MNNSLEYIALISMKNTGLLVSLSDTDKIGLWVFGYGSIIWRPEIPFKVAHWATVSGWSRRFWQGSHDHRGTIASPGRVLTMVPFEGMYCEGRVFGVDQANVEQVLQDLDYREKNGYERQQLKVTTKELGDINALTYIAPPTNPAWLGDASDEAIAHQIKNSVGPSGENRDYVLSLHEALLGQNIHDEHIQAIAKLVT